MILDFGFDFNFSFWIFWVLILLILQNTNLLQTSSSNLPDKGQKLRNQNSQLRDQESELVAKIMHAKDNLVSFLFYLS